MEWADYLFQNGSMLGLNADILKKYMMFLTNSRLKAIGLEPIFDRSKEGDSEEIVKRITKLVNGGYHGLQDRIDKFNFFKELV